MDLLLISSFLRSVHALCSWSFPGGAEMLQCQAEGCSHPEQGEEGGGQAPAPAPGRAHLSSFTTLASEFQSAAKATSVPNKEEMQMPRLLTSPEIL